MSQIINEDILVTNILVDVKWIENNKVYLISKS